ncbi:MAG TPA: YggS family pyridoxal phosphate-dependent enzyme [Chitinophagaceae bacterium]|nr:YggS family pyridoxal phosphate-dependent enzyme [Chitinophagaceae bacterium]
MSVNKEAYLKISEELRSKNVTLVAVSKTKPVEDIKALYDLGQRDFGENYVQELTEKAEQLPKDIRWHFIGHLQSNKVKYIAPFIHLIHVADSLKLLQEINKQALKNTRTIDCLLQMHIAQEETKFGLNEDELTQVLTGIGESSLAGIRVKGLMGMASFTDDMNKVRNEFRYLKTLFDKHSPFTIHHSLFTTLSMGMSSDYKIAVEEGSTMVRIGSLLFGERSN